MIKPIKETLKSIEDELVGLRRNGYEVGYADGYNAALGKPPTKEGSTADLKELEKEAEVND